MRGQSPELPATAFRRRLLRAGGWTAGGLVLVVGGLYVSGWGSEAWQRLKLRRAERFTDEGYEAWQAGRHRQAELLFVNAVQADPGTRRARLLHGRMLVQTGNLAKGRDVFARLLAEEKGAARAETAALYFDTLVGTAAFAELVRFCETELPGLSPSLRSQWGAAAVEATRLAGLLPTERVAAGPAAGETPTALAALLAAQQCINAGREDAARAWLSRLDGRQLEGSLQASAVRVLLKLHGPDRVRPLLASVGRPLEDSELAFNELWLSAGREDAAPFAGRLVAAAFPPTVAPAVAMERIGRLMLFPDAGLPPVLAERLQAGAAAFPTEEISALWLMWELNRAGLRDNPWSAPLSERLHFTVLARDPGELTLRQFTGIVNSVPLARDTVVALMMRLPASRI